jgi:polyisoprenoid-binding protein YceI
MKRTFVVSRSVMSRIRVSKAGALGVLVAGLVLMGSASLSLAQGPGGPGGPGQRQGPPPPPAPPTAGAHLEIIDGSSASYRVTEQLAGINFPNDAIGTSPTVAGTIGITADGSITPGSKLTIDLRNLKSDQDQRDGYVRNRTLETEKFPLAEFVPTKLQGLPLMIPTQGQTGLQLTGNLTIHGVTKEVTFQGVATYGRDSTVAGRAKTSFTFSTFGLTKPTLARLVSVDDKIELEIVFKFKRT